MPSDLPTTPTEDRAAAKHTPGPWLIDTRIRTTINAGNKHIAMVNYYQSSDPDVAVCGAEHDANAALIARAPDMDAALRCAMAALHNCLETGVLPTVVEDAALTALVNARQALGEEA